MTNLSLRDLAIPLRTLDPADADLSDLEPLRHIVGDARVVSIGESAHAVHEFYELKHRLLRYLVAELGFSAFAMESGFPEGLAVNDWVLGGGGDLEQIARTGITYRMGECEEMRAQLQWMREWNATHDRKVHFYGMDVPGSCANPRPAIEVCLARLDPLPGDAALLELATLGDNQAEAIDRYQTMEPAVRERLSKGIAGLVERASAARDEITYRCAVSVRRLNELYPAGSYQSESRNPRDELMADNIHWILNREERIVIGAHNGHIQREPLQWESGPLPMLGKFLAPALGKDMVVIGTTYASGQIILGNILNGRSTASLYELEPPPAYTIDALMDSVGFPLHLVDLRRVPAERLSAATAMRANGHAVDLDPKQCFDALIHVRHVTPTSGVLGLFEEYQKMPSPT